MSPLAMSLGDGFCLSRKGVGWAHTSRITIGRPEISSNSTAVPRYTHIVRSNLKNFLGYLRNPNMSLALALFQVIVIPGFSH